MYCKKCGKSLPNGARFCDRCNTSVRKKSGRQELIEDLKEERLARRKAKVVEERLKKIKKIKHKKFKLIVSSLVILIVLGIVSAVTANIIFSRTSTLNKAIDEVPDTTEEPAETEEPGQEINSDGYIVMPFYSGSFAYPSSFVPDGEADGTVLVLTDSFGDASLTAGMSAAPQTEPSAAMKSCIDTNGLISPKGAVSENTYSVTGKRGENTYHRFGRITDGEELYYELVYPAVSDDAAAYEEYAEYMDSFLKDE